MFTGWGIAGLLAPVAAAAVAVVTGYGDVYGAFIVVAVLAWVCVGIYGRLAATATAPPIVRGDQASKVSWRR